MYPACRRARLPGTMTPGTMTSHTVTHIHTHTHTQQRCTNETHSLTSALCLVRAHGISRWFDSSRPRPSHPKPPSLPRAAQSTLGTLQPCPAWTVSRSRAPGTYTCAAPGPSSTPQRKQQQAAVSNSTDAHLVVHCYSVNETQLRPCGHITSYTDRTAASTRKRVRR